MVNLVLIFSLFKGTLVYTKQIQTLKADFWKEGVGGSKKLLKKILKKITNYEAQHVNLDEQVNKEPDNVKKMIHSLISDDFDFDSTLGWQFKEKVYNSLQHFGTKILINFASRWIRS